VALVGLGLEATVTHLGRSVHKLQLDVLQGGPLGVDQERLAQGQNPLLRPNAASLDHDKVLLDHAVVGEAAHGVDALVGGVVLGRGIVLNQLAVLLVVSELDVVDLLVDLCAVVVTLLTSTGHRVLDAGGMPGADTGDLAETLVRLPGQLLGVPPGRDTLESLSLGDANQVDHLVLGEDVHDGDSLLEHSVGVVDLVGHGSAVQLDLHDVGLLLTLAQQLLLSVGNQPHHLAVLLDLGQVLLDLFLADLILPLEASLGEGLLLGLGPIVSVPTPKKAISGGQTITHCEGGGGKEERKRNKLAKLNLAWTVSSGPEFMSGNLRFHLVAQWNSWRPERKLPAGVDSRRRKCERKRAFYIQTWALAA